MSPEMPDSANERSWLYNHIGRLSGLLLGLIFVILLLVLAVNGYAPATSLLVIVVIIAAVVIGGGYVSSRNQMVTLNEAVKSNWAQVDVVLQRRADLIPNLVNTVKGFAAHEETVFGDIANARAALLGAKTPGDKIAANGQLDGALGRLLAISENYPQPPPGKAISCCTALARTTELSKV